MRIQVEWLPDEGTSLPNVVIFGESGTGKSSLVNMIAGGDIARTSNEALGCTFGSVPYDVTVNGTALRLWDTAGLNEADYGSVSSEQAMRNLHDLIGHLKDGVSLLVYCIRGTRFRDILQVNYEIFSRIICQGKVPIVIVATGLEHEVPMEKWWEENGEELQKRGMGFQGRACVTATKGKLRKSGEYMYEEEYSESQEAVRTLITKHLSPQRAKMDKKKWISSVRDAVQGIGPAGGSYFLGVVWSEGRRATYTQPFV
ncbi:hypothetical protein JAAARDRAFT_68872 [Jaapia argillacea MUCL 33604]|uniref:G domain-containing protein n=1 Tax=Jaapia argillacea MUCL 33604 TaxID=933084 RepID=A0A067Q4D1_9AGAM|nr:hypothetical protein JAAARDRAFT_68872 [Jaapia argillacea MUCL 33604]